MLWTLFLVVGRVAFAALLLGLLMLAGASLAVAVAAIDEAIREAFSRGPHEN